MQLRTLAGRERETLLELLDGWPLADGWRGRDFFRRYIELDETYRDRNFWVAEEKGELVACVQIFPRQIRVRGVAVPLGGIGSVFTAPRWRGRGIASALLERAAEAMRADGAVLSLLLSDRTAFYSRLGWRPWPGPRWLLDRGAGVAAGAARADKLDDFHPERDLGEVAAIYRSYGERFDGAVIRDEASWRTSLRVAGNPAEVFRVARGTEGVRAYLRATVLYGVLVVLELGRRVGAARSLAALVAELFEPRDPDPLVPPGRSSAEIRRFVASPAPADPELRSALAESGVRCRSIVDRSHMLRCLDGEKLAALTGIARRPGESSEAFLARVLPPDRFLFWPADRF